MMIVRMRCRIRMPEVLGHLLFVPNTQQVYTAQASLQLCVVMWMKSLQRSRGIKDHPKAGRRLSYPLICTLWRSGGPWGATSLGSQGTAWAVCHWKLTLLCLDNYVFGVLLITAASGTVTYTGSTQVFKLIYCVISVPVKLFELPHVWTRITAFIITFIGTICNRACKENVSVHARKQNKGIAQNTEKQTVVTNYWTSQDGDTLFENLINFKNTETQLPAKR